MWWQKIGNLKIEVSGDGIAHVSLDQSFKPVGRLGPLVIAVKGCHERGHGSYRVYAQRFDVGADQRVVAKLDVGQFGHPDRFAHAWREFRIGGNSEKSGQFAVCDNAEEFGQSLRWWFHLAIESPAKGIRLQHYDLTHIRRPKSPP
ncbi:hypothetical protein GALL_477960 [mine drainage metagenome]|uniref:Uncharacterized protein n=1 Tax=mine drainage metagenome TaxID=410659 RepID=A0A1J5PS72_9ZZZZ